jgi:hypothetical protein
MMEHEVGYLLSDDLVVDVFYTLLATFSVI